MGIPVYIGDEWTAAGWRLAGARVIVPRDEAGDEATAVRRAFDQVRADAPPLVLIGARLARQLDPERLIEARSRLDPPVLVVGDAAGAERPDDIAGSIRERMGVAR